MTLLNDTRDAFYAAAREVGYPATKASLRKSIRPATIRLGDGGEILGAVVVRYSDAWAVGFQGLLPAPRYLIGEQLHKAAKRRLKKKGLGLYDFFYNTDVVTTREVTPRVLRGGHKEGTAAHWRFMDRSRIVDR